MSAAPYIQVRTQYKQRQSTPAPPHQPNRSARRRAARSSSSVEQLVAHLVLFAVVAGGAYGFSSLLGNAKAELARQETIDASRRARRAELDIVRLRDSVDRLGNAEVVGEWAIARGFVPAFGEGAHAGSVQ